MKHYVSLDNARTYLDAEEAMVEIEERPYLWDVLVDAMDDEIREAVHCDLAPCTKLEFLAEYLRRIEEDVIIG